MYKRWTSAMMAPYEDQEEYFDHRYLPFFSKGLYRYPTICDMQTATTLVVWFGTSTGSGVLERILVEVDKFKIFDKKRDAALMHFAKENRNEKVVNHGKFFNYLDEALNRRATREDLDVAHHLVQWFATSEGNKLFWRASVAVSKRNQPSFRLLRKDIYFT
jgi:hypothetical protein